MFKISAKLVKAPPSAETILKNINYGTAVGLTKTAKEAQKAEIGKIRTGLGWFIRNNWLENSPVGIKITPATRDKLEATIYTRAKFLPLHETGGTKIPYKNYFAIPIVPFARSSKSAKIPNQNLPKNLKNAFILTTKSGKKFLCIRKNTGRSRRGAAVSALPQSGGRQTSGLVTMYYLAPRATLKGRDFFVSELNKVVTRKLALNISEEVRRALLDMR